MILPRVVFNIHRSKYSFSFSTRVNMHTLRFGDTREQKRRRGCTIKCLGGKESRARAGRRVNVGKIVKIRQELGVERVKKWEACSSILLVQYYRLVSLFDDLARVCSATVVAPRGCAPDSVSGLIDCVSSITTSPFYICTPFTRRK